MRVGNHPRAMNRPRVRECGRMECRDEPRLGFGLAGTRVRCVTDDQTRHQCQVQPEDRAETPGHDLQINFQARSGSRGAYQVYQPHALCARRDLHPGRPSRPGYENRASHLRLWPSNFSGAGTRKRMPKESVMT
jgi:hypothetical protein